MLCSAAAVAGLLVVTSVEVDADPVIGRTRAGIYVQAIPSQLRQYFGAPPDRGLLVVGVEAGRAGERAGLRAGDVIVGANDRPVRMPSDLLRIIAATRPGHPLRLRVLRNGKEESLQIWPEAVGCTDPLRPVVARSTPRPDHVDREDIIRQIRRLRAKLDALERSLGEQPAR